MLKQKLQKRRVRVPEEVPLRFLFFAEGGFSWAGSVVFSGSTSTEPEIFTELSSLAFFFSNLAISLPNFFLSKRMPANKNDESLDIGLEDKEGAAVSIRGFAV